MANKFLDENGLLYLWQKITAKFATKEDIANAGGGDMSKSTYDADNDGKVDNANNADKLGGHSPDYYVSKEELSDIAPATHSHTTADITDFEDVMDGYATSFSDAIDSVVEIANGKCASYVFATVAELETWLTNTTNTAKLNVGDVFLIKAVDVPDYWWDGSAKQILETTKVDLSTISNAEIDTIVAS